MKAMLLAAGLGTRLRPLTLKMPKCLVPINGRPLLDYWLETIFKAGIESVMINLHYMPEQVEAHISNSDYHDKVDLVYEKELLGTAGTLLRNKDYFKGDQILLIHADNYSIFSMDEFQQAHESRPDGCEITMMTFETDTPKSCGIVELDEHGVVKGFHEKVKKPPGNLANGAVYILEDSIISYLEELGTEEIDFSTQVLPAFINRIYTFHNAVYHRDIGTIEAYQKAQRRK
jgi:mannose-1-phosphate guanylyltransferase